MSVTWAGRSTSHDVSPNSSGRDRRVFDGSECDRNLRAASIASKIVCRAAARTAADALKDALAAALVAACADPMRWLAGQHFRLRLVCEDTGSNLGKLVARLFSLPVFKLYDLLFKISYTLNQFRLRRMGSHSSGLRGHDYACQFDSLFADQHSVADADHRLRDIGRSLEGRGKSRNG